MRGRVAVPSMRRIFDEPATEWMHGLRGRNRLGTDHFIAGCSGRRGCAAACGRNAEFGADAPVVAVQWKQWEYTYWPRQPWDWAWGAPPYSFPQGRQSHVIYYAAAPYYYPSFQTTLGYNGHFGYPAAVQYADPPPVGGTHRSYAPRRGSYPEAFD
jgi:hypothetical protein